MGQNQILILGGGESGVGAALLAKHLGFDVYVSDSGIIREQYRNELAENSISFEEGGHRLAFDVSGLVIKSPGIARQSEIVMHLEKKGLEIISETAFAARNTRAKIIGITGSNGKTTTTALTGHVLKECGADVCVCGNIGKSFARCLNERDYDVFVVELSSFQLEHMPGFRPDIAVLTNITPDHMERYSNDFSAYAAAKFNITISQHERDVFIYNADDAAITDRINKLRTPARLLPFSLQTTMSIGAWIENDNIVVNLDNEPFTMKIETLALQGKHNLYNTMAAAIAANMFDFRKDTLKKSFQTFQKIEHRLEFVAKVHGVAFYNDSKATNVNSVWYALESMKAPIIWIAGGVDKGNEYTSLLPLVKEKVKALICLGTDNSKLHDAFGDHIEVMLDTTSMMDAVASAYRMGNPGDVVLLSPACASFDLFENYEDRGNQFKIAIREL